MVHAHACMCTCVQSVADGDCAGVCVCARGQANSKEKEIIKTKIHQKERHMQPI